MRTLLFNEDGQVRIPWRIAAIIVLLAGIVIAINSGWRAAGLPGQKTASDMQHFAFALLITGATLALILRLLRVFEHRGLDAIWLPFNRSAVPQLALGTLLGSIPIVLVVLAATLGGYGAVTRGNIVMGALLTTLLPMLGTVLLLSGWEELTMRGYLFRQLALTRSGPFFAAVITGILFGVLHSGSPGANWQGVLFTAIGGILMGLLLIRSRSLWLLIGYHFGWNACSGNLFGLSVSGRDVGSSVLVTALSGSDWLTGGSYGFESSVPAVVAEAGTLSVVLFLMARKGREPLKL